MNHLFIRYGFSTEKDYNDSELYCGGWSRQHQRNGGKCGVCGDAWDMPQVSSHPIKWKDSFLFQHSF